VPAARGKRTSNSPALNTDGVLAPVADPSTLHTSRLLKWLSNDVLPLMHHSLELKSVLVIDDSSVDHATKAKEIELSLPVGNSYDGTRNGHDFLAQWQQDDDR
jgi:hypothetical protein